jgi:hypothetical protein
MFCILRFLIILGHFARIAGSFIVGGIFALRLFGVSRAGDGLVVQGSSVPSVAGIGMLAMWQQGVALSALRAT